MALIKKKYNARRIWKGDFKWLYVSSKFDMTFYGF